MSIPYRLLSLIGIALILNILGSLFIAGLAFTQGVSILELSGERISQLPVELIRCILFVNQIFSFLLPSILFGYLFYKKEMWNSFYLNKAPILKNAIIAICLLAASYPLVILSYKANMALPLPEWISSLEQSTVDTLMKVLTMDTPAVFLMNLILIAVLPAIGEELMFRGVLQNQLAKWIKNEHLGIFLASTIFSAIHLQFEGFLPRLALGMVLGYLYFWTRNLWIPIIVHFLNNATQVVAIYTGNQQVSDINGGSIPEIHWSTYPISIILIMFLYKFLRPRVKQYDV